MTIIIDPRYIDVDFTKEQAYTFGAFGARHFADHGPFYEDVLPMIPEDEWGDRVKELDDTDTGLEWLVKHIYNQGNEGSCVGNMGAAGINLIQSAEKGIDAVDLVSPIDLYKRIGSSPNSGAMVDDCMEQLEANGIAPLDTPENRAKYGNHVMPATGFYTQTPSGIATTRAKFRLGERFVVRSVAGIISAQLSGHPVGVGRAGHSILYIRPAYRNKRYGETNSLLNFYQNSWGQWGQGLGRLPAGFGADSLGLIRESAYWAFAFRAIKGE